MLADQQQVILRQLLEEPVNQDDNRATIKAKHFYKSCVDIREYSLLHIFFLLKKCINLLKNLLKLRMKNQ